MQISIIANPLLPAAQALYEEITARLDGYGIAHKDVTIEQADVVITIGGDGTVLRASACGKPILGVHAGSVGFLTEIDKTELDLLKRLITGDYLVEERMQIQGSGARNEESGINTALPPPPFLLSPVLALNEIALTAPHNERNRHCVNITAFENGKPFAEYRGDGVIFATPTGSTGYSLSAGGAIFDPTMEAILLTPLYSHTLGAKPLVFSPDTELSIVSRETLFVSADGGEPLELSAGKRLMINRADEIVRFVRLKDKPFAARLNKLR